MVTPQLTDWKEVSEEYERKARPVGGWISGGLGKGHAQFSSKFIVQGSEFLETATAKYLTTNYSYLTS